MWKAVATERVEFAWRRRGPVHHTIAAAKVLVYLLRNVGQSSNQSTSFLDKEYLLYTLQKQAVDFLIYQEWAEVTQRLIYNRNEIVTRKYLVPIYSLLVPVNFIRIIFFFLFVFFADIPAPDETRWLLKEMLRNVKRIRSEAIGA